MENNRNIMRYLKTHKDFTNEEISFKKAMVGGAVALSWCPIRDL